MKANYQLLIISCQSPDGTEYHKSFEGLKISPKLPNCLICMLTKLFYFSDNFSGYCCSFINISPDISVTRQKVCSVLGTGGRAPCAYFCIPLCLFSARLLPFCVPSPGAVKLISAREKREIQGVKSQSKIHRLTGAIPWERHGCIIVKNRMFEKNLLACISPKNKLEAIWGKLSTNKHENFRQRGFKTSG